MKLPLRPLNSNKATFGNVLNIAGSVNYRGAAYLSSISALRIGAGYVTLASVEPAINAISSQTPDLVFLPLKDQCGSISSSEFAKIEHSLSKASVVSMGCGLSCINTSLEDLKLLVYMLLEAVARLDLPIVLDADGLNVLSSMDKKPKLPKHIVMTPHPKELSRLLGVNVMLQKKDREYVAELAAKKFGAVVLLKGHDTVISNGTKIVTNDTGNSALAKAGSGDVLTGVIAGLLAQGASPFEAAVLGAKIHGLAGELASNDLSEYGVLASDLLKYLPLAIQKIQI